MRLHPSEDETAGQARSSADPGAAGRPASCGGAQEVFDARESPKSFSLDLSELERRTAVPACLSRASCLGELETRRHGALTYSRSIAQAEDVTLFDRDRQRTIALYPSPERVSARGASYNEDDYRDFDILDYNIDATVSPQRESSIEGRARLRLRVRAFALSSLTLRLADALSVTSVTSPEYGRLLHLRVRGQDSVIVSLPVEVNQDSELTLVVVVQGPVWTAGD